jgi:hypothetical protein
MLVNPISGHRAAARIDRQLASGRSEIKAAGSEFLRVSANLQADLKLLIVGLGPYPGSNRQPARECLRPGGVGTDLVMKLLVNRNYVSRMSIARSPNLAARGGRHSGVRWMKGPAAG